MQEVCVHSQWQLLFKVSTVTAEVASSHPLVGMGISRDRLLKGDGSR